MSNRQDNAYITASITDSAGTLNLGRFEDRSGGDSDSASVSFARAGMGGREAMGGRQEIPNVIIKTLYDAEKQAIIARLRKGAGRATMQISETPTDSEGNVQGGAPTETWHGMLKKVHVMDRVTDSAGAETLELEMVVSGEVVVT